MTLLRAHTEGFIELGFRSIKEIRLSPLGFDLYTSGTTRPAIPGPRGVSAPVNCDWRFRKNVPWDLVEYLAAPPPGPDGQLVDRKARTTTFLTPPDLAWDEAILYYRLRCWWRRFSVDQTVELLEALAEPVRGEDPEQVAEMAAGFAAPRVTVAEIATLVRHTLG